MNRQKIKGRMNVLKLPNSMELNVWHFGPLIVLFLWKESSPFIIPSSSMNLVWFLSLYFSMHTHGGICAHGLYWFQFPGELGESLNTHHLSPYLKPLGSDFSNGVNFAIAGSTATPGLSPFSLNMQLEQFLFFKQRSQELINQGLKGPIDQEGFKNALYTMDIGQNDVTALLHLPYDQTLAKFPPIVAEIKNAVQTLYRDGGRKFWIHGTGALGCLPQKLAMPRKDDSDLDKNGCLKTFNKAAKAFNALLSDVCDQLRWQMTDAAIVYTDLFAIKYDLVANHTKYGIEKPLMTCCGFGGPPYNYDPTRSCMSVDAQLCAYGSKFISWDGVHFTDAANGIVAAKILTGEFSKPKIKLASLINSSKSVDN